MQLVHLSPRAREVHDIHDSLQAVELDNDGSMDKTLLAIAQLATFQTKTQRAIISLVDDSYQYILTEATQSSSLAECTAQSSLFRHSRIPRGSLDCAHCLLEEEVRHEDVPDDGLVVPDSGHQIGVLAIFDASPRPYSTQKELENLREYAACAVSHLELIRMSMDCTRKSKLLRAIATSMDDQYPCIKLQEESREGSDGRETTDVSISDMQQNTNIPPSIDSPLPVEQSGTTQRQLTSAFRAAARALQNSLLADDIAIYGPIGFAQLAETDVTNDNGNDADDVPSTIQSTLLATSLHEKDESLADTQSTPSVGILRALSVKHPGGESFQFLNGDALEDFGGPENVSHSESQEIDNNDVSFHDCTDQQILDNLHIHGMNQHSRNLVFLPVYHPQKRDLLAACFLWSYPGKYVAPLSPNFDDLHAIGSCLSQHVAQILSKGMETGFLSNFSHELRSPIHGVMGAAQFLMDTTSSSYQHGLIESILTCSNTLLDTLNLVLDHTKLGRTTGEALVPDTVHHKSSTNVSTVSSMFVSEAVDLALVIEEATESVVAGHFFENPARATDPDDHKDQSEDEDGRRECVPSNSHDVRVILSLAVHNNWSVQSQPGAIRRIIMNLLGNSLKFTPHGSITIALDRDDSSNVDDSSTLGFCIKIEDTGIGMSRRFQEDSLFTPFRQQNRFEPGVGLGLSVVHRIVESLGGKVVVHSKSGEGTSIDINLSLPLNQNPCAGIPEDLQDIVAKVRGKHLVFIDAYSYDQQPEESIRRREEALREVAANWLGMRVSKTGDMNVKDADFYLYSEPPPPHELLERHRQTPDHELSSGEIPLIVVATDAKEAHTIESNYAKALEEAGRIVEVLSQPCGPRKLAKVLKASLDRQTQSMKDRTRPDERQPDVVPSSLAHDPGVPSDAEPPRPKIDKDGQRNKSNTVHGFEGSRSLSSPLYHDNQPRSKLDETSKALPHRLSNGTPPHDDQGASTPSKDDKIASESADKFTEHHNTEPKSETTSDHHPAHDATSMPDQTTLRGLIVDDNRVNLRLLVTLMKKSQYSYAEADNGQEALNAFKASSGSSTEADATPQPFDFILMDIGMPVMNGIEATKLIREHEQKHSLRPTKIIALTAWADTKTQDEALASGMDMFLPKPVKFTQLKGILRNIQNSYKEQ
ncbi:hypothetical protein Q7P37_010505 [Cladosporium fusiforme]